MRMDFLVMQWIRICLPTQRTRVQFPGQKIVSHGTTNTSTTGAVLQESHTGSATEPHATATEACASEEATTRQPHTVKSLLAAKLSQQPYSPTKNNNKNELIKKRLRAKKCSLNNKIAAKKTKMMKQKGEIRWN